MLSGMLQTLHSQDTLLSKHRKYYKVALANAGLCILGGFVLYAIAAMCNKAISGNFLFFSETGSQGKVKDLHQAIVGPDDVLVGPKKPS